MNLPSPRLRRGGQDEQDSKKQSGTKFLLWVEAFFHTVNPVNPVNPV
jgi:hypothetical protein